MTTASRGLDPPAATGRGSGSGHSTSWQWRCEPFEGQPTPRCTLGTTTVRCPIGHLSAVSLGGDGNSDRTDSEKRRIERIMNTWEGATARPNATIAATAEGSGASVASNASTSINKAN